MKNIMMRKRSIIHLSELNHEVPREVPLLIPNELKNILYSCFVMMHSLGIMNGVK